MPSVPDGKRWDTARGGVPTGQGKACVRTMGNSGVPRACVCLSPTLTEADTHEVLEGGLWGPDGGPRAWLLALLPPLLLRATSAGLSATTEL